jgi:4-amino-4-deoxy-L-arabinose transferase-like glycosyltransferase
MKVPKNTKILILIFVVGIIFRLWHIDFGLPYHTHNDEPELVELAITPAVEFKRVFLENNLDLLKPSSFIYGTVPSYLIFPVLAGYSQIAQGLNLSFNKADLYLISRAFTAVTSLLVIWATWKMYKTLLGNKGALMAAAITALNWKLIVFGHFVNSDIYLTIFTTLLLMFFLSYLENKKIKNILLAGIFLGLAVGTKITGAILIPMLLYVFLTKKDWKGLAYFSLAGIVSFSLTNPFSITYFSEFTGRILRMKTQEAGMVLSSVSDNPIRYLLSTGYIATPLVALMALYGKWKALKQEQRLTQHIFLIGCVITYILFFTLTGKRQTDRWMLPIVPIVIVYASFGISQILNKLNRFKKAIVLVTLLASISYFPILLLFQFKSNTPKVEGFLWAKENITETSTKLIIEESKNSVFGKLPNSEIYMFNVYESKGALEEMPPNTKGYDYIIIASKTMLNHKKPYVIEHFPEYSKKWNTFENNLNNKEKYEKVVEFALPKPNIITLSNITIYRNLGSQVIF